MDLTRVVAIACLTIICCVALIRGIDSALVGVVCSTIGALAGYGVRRLREKEKE